MKGIIIKGIGGFYYVHTEENVITQKSDGNKENTYRCRGRKSIKDKGITLAVGDYVEFSLSEEGNDSDGTIEKIYSRKNSFIRPPIVNVDKFLIVAACNNPKINFSLLDKFIITAEVNNAEPIICFSKCELLDNKTKEIIEKAYAENYKTVMVSSKENIGIDKLKKLIKEEGTVAFAGPSGVGKSTLINKIIPNAKMETGEISKKSNRGKHTTRHVEMFSFGNGWIFDTPGFTSFNILEVDEYTLGSYYPEIFQYSEECKFHNCKHIKEPKCAVREAVNLGNITQTRYESYTYNLTELERKDKHNG